MVKGSEDFSVLSPSFPVRSYRLETPHKSLKLLHLASILPKYRLPQRVCSSFENASLGSFSCFSWKVLLYLIAYQEQSFPCTPSHLGGLWFKIVRLVIVDALEICSQWTQIKFLASRHSQIQYAQVSLVILEYQRAKGHDLTWDPQQPADPHACCRSMV